MAWVGRSLGTAPEGSSEGERDGTDLMDSLALRSCFGGFSRAPDKEMMENRRGRAVAAAPAKRRGRWRRREEGERSGIGASES